MLHLILFFFISVFAFFTRSTYHDFSFGLSYVVLGFLFLTFIHQDEILSDIKSRIREKKYTEFSDCIYSSTFDFVETHKLQILHNTQPSYDNKFEYNTNLYFIIVPKDKLLLTLNNLQMFYKNLAKDKFLYYDFPDELVLENYYKEYFGIFSFKTKDLSKTIFLKIYNPNDDLIRIGLLLN